MSICYSCEDFLEDNRRVQKSVCTQCTNSFCGGCSTRLFLNKQSTCLRCQFADNLLEVGFNPDHLDRFNIHDLRWVLFQHDIDYELNSDKDQLINVLGSFLANHSFNHGRPNQFNNDPIEVYDVEDEENLEDEDLEYEDFDGENQEYDDPDGEYLEYDDLEDEHLEDEDEYNLIDEENDFEELEEDVQQDFENEDEVLQVSMHFDENNSSSTSGMASIEENSNATDEYSNTDNESRQCKICFGGPANCAFLACGHVMACDKCAPRLKNCPICRQKITRFIKVFFS